jgi:alanyl-tRNA synthetase
VKGSEVREGFLRFFEARGHKRLPSDSLVPKNDPTLLFTGAGMNQFKDMFLGKGTLPWRRIATAQKCLRVPDLEKVGATPRHHTFFEMLGNFSFGDYFKRECIPWEWEFFTRECGIPEGSLVVSVFEEDEEAAGVWREIVGLAPERIFRFGDAENFWPAEARAKGPNGPCGPCSEIYFDARPREKLPPTRGLRSLPEERFTEIGNCVFTQFERHGSDRAGETGVLLPLPQKNIDVGLGLERITAVLQGAPNNFETDLFLPLLEAIAERTGRRYGTDPRADVRMRRIADHVRAVVFCVADGVLPGNEERNYVVRKILRRAIRDGYELGVEEPFLHTLAAVVSSTMGEAYPEVVQHRHTVEIAICAEEERFREIYRRGRAFLDERIERARAGGGKAFSGADAFELHDTYGFPADLTRVIAEEGGLSFDEEGFERAMRGQRERARSKTTMKGEVFAGGALAEMKGEHIPTSAFVGYETDAVTEEPILAILTPTSPRDFAGGTRSGELPTSAEEAALVVRHTPFYAEAGGQVGDRGTIRGAEGGSFTVTDCWDVDGYHLHIGKVEKGRIRLGEKVELRVDPEWRWRVTKNHTATHLLHKALKVVLGPSVGQAGSLVHPEYLRFDFTWGERLTEEQKRAVEDLVNRRVMEAIPVTWKVKPIEEARKEGAVMMFGEKYGERVRVLRVGDFSVELCGGTHVANTGNIGPFRITKEQALGAGVRRIFALTGPAAVAYLRGRDESLEGIARALKTTPERVIERLEALQKEVKEAKSRRPASSPSGDPLPELLRSERRIGPFRFVAGRVEGAGIGTLRALLPRLLRELGRSGVVALAGASGDSVPFVLAAGPGAAAGGFDANREARAFGERLGGGGGGKPDLAQGEGKSVEALDGAFEALASALESGAGAAVDTPRGPT